MKQFIQKHSNGIKSVAVIIALFGGIIAYGLADYAEKNFWAYFWLVATGVCIVVFLLAVAFFTKKDKTTKDNK